MATDREGTTINVGDVVFPAGQVTSIDGTTIAVRFKPGQVVATDSNCLVSANVSSAAAAAASTASWQIVWREHFAEIETGLWDTVSTGTASAFHQDAGGISALDTVPGWGWARVHCGSSTGTSSYAYFCMDEVNDLGRMLASTNNWRVRFRACTPNSGNLKASWGLTNVAPTTLRPTNSLTFEADVGASANIRAITYDGTTTNNTDTGETVASINIASAGSARWFEIRCRSGNVEFRIDNTSVATMTSNLPTAANSYFAPFFFTQENGSTFRGLLVDYIDVAMPSEWMAPEGY